MTNLVQSDFSTSYFCYNCGIGCYTRNNNHYNIVTTATIGLRPEGIQCACAGDRLIYNCSIVGGTATRWRGTAFDCPLGITLRHSQFAANQESGTCNNGDLVGHSIGVANDCYTS